MRVLVTRPQPEGDALATRLIAMGHAPIVAPVMAIVPLAVTLPARRIDAVLATSLQATAALDATLRAALTPLPIYVVGAASAQAARRAGFTDLRIGAGDAAALADLVRLTCPRGAHLIHLAGRVHKTALPTALQADGYVVTSVESYDARAVERWADTVAAGADAAAFEACLHFSRRSADLALAGSRGRRLEAVFDAAWHLCLSDDVAEPLRAAALPHVTVSTEPTLASLLQDLTCRMSH